MKSQNSNGIFKEAGLNKFCERIKECKNAGLSFESFYGLLFSPSFNLIPFILLLYTFNIFAQDSIMVKGRFLDNSKYAKVLMKKFGVGTISVGGATIKKDSFYLALPPDIDPGVYRFQYAMAEEEQYVDIIINGKEKEINFTLQANDPLAMPQFTVSDENKLWYDYLDQNRNQLERINLLNQFINAYPNPNKQVIKAAEQEWLQEKELYWENFDVFKTQMKGSWAFEMVSNRPYYFANPSDDPRIQDFEKREHFWDGFDSNNVKLLNTPLYTEHIINYLRYWMNPKMNFSAEEKTNGFKRAVDIIIRKFSGNEATHTFAYKYLSLGFKEIGEEEVLHYLDENYKDLAVQCFDEFEKSEFEERMIGYAAMKVGNKAPDFEIRNETEKTRVKSLYTLKANQTLVVFWSSTCPHCMEEMPKLNEWAKKNTTIKVIAVSLDTNKEVHTETIKQFSYLLHSCDYKGWETESSKRYFIAATPTFIVLDKDKKIVGKWSSFDQFASKIIQ